MSISFKHIPSHVMRNDRSESCHGCTSDKCMSTREANKEFARLACKQKREKHAEQANK